MKQLTTFCLLLFSALILSGCTLWPNRNQAALSVNTVPKATIFLDGEHLGQTPYSNEKLKSGEHILKIVPESTGQALTPWESRITLTSGILTVVNREMGLTQDLSSGEILSFEPLADKKAMSIAVISTPDGAEVNLDGEPKGFAPVSIDNVSEGQHVIKINSPGYVEKSITAKTVKGNKLIVSVQLAREVEAVAPTDIPEATPSATPKTSPKISPSPLTSPKATSSATPKPSFSPGTQLNSVQPLQVNGFANVRSESSSAGTIVAKIDYPDKFSILDTATSGGHTWYKIEYETAKEGWVRDDVVQKMN